VAKAKATIAFRAFAGIRFHLEQHSFFKHGGGSNNYEGWPVRGWERQLRNLFHTVAASTNI
jgi:hypothetical protein